MFYSDEDKIDESGRRSSPHFKPSFNLDLLLAYNFISHLGVYRTETVRSLGGFRIGLEGSQDHDLALRVVQDSGINQIVHIPRVLYHWRMHEASTAINPGSKDYTTQRGLRAVQEFLNQDAPITEQSLLSPPALRPTGFAANGLSQSNNRRWSWSSQHGTRRRS